MSALRRRTTAALTVVLVAIPLVLLGSPAHADHDDHGLLVSTSPTGPFHEHLPTPLFADDGPFVPRDRATATFYVKNASPDVAHATLAVVDRDQRPVFESALAFRARLGAGGWQEVRPVDAATCRSLATGPDIASQDVQAVDVALEVADLIGQNGMEEQATLDFIVTLAQGTGGPACDAGSGDGDAEDQPPGPSASDPSDAGTAVDCDRAAVITVTGTPTCVPSVVDAGQDSGTVRPPALVALLSVLLLATGASLVLWGGRRTPDRPAIPA